MITQKELKEVLHYDPTTGVFVWIKHRKSNKIRTEAGSVNLGYRRIQIKYESYPAHRLAWLYMYGHHPTNLIDHINHNTLDNQANL